MNPDQIPYTAGPLSIPVVRAAPPKRARGRGRGSGRGQKRKQQDDMNGSCDNIIVDSDPDEHQAPGEIEDDNDTSAGNESNDVAGSTTDDENTQGPSASHQRNGGHHRLEESADHDTMPHDIDMDLDGDSLPPPPPPAPVARYRSSVRRHDPAFVLTSRSKRSTVWVGDIAIVRRDDQTVSILIISGSQLTAVK